MSHPRFPFKASLRLAAAALTALALSTTAAFGAVRTFYGYDSEPGDYIGAGQLNHYTAQDATIALLGTAQYLTMSVSTPTEFWYVNLAAPHGEKLHPGKYYQAERAPFRTGRSPGLDVYGDGRGCNQVWGSFTVNQIVTDASGNVTLLDASFEQQCESPTAPALHGAVLYRAPSLSFAYQSDPGDYIGGGQSRQYTNAQSIFTLNGGANSLQYGVSGERDTWTALISAPFGQSLQPGTYATMRFADATHAGLDFFGDGRGCNQSTGTLTITALSVNGQGAPTRFGATFEQHCEDGAPALHGSIHYRD